MIYLDYQASTPLAPEAFDAMVPWLRDHFANPHSASRLGRAAKAAIEVAREQIAALLPPGGRVVFTSGATEALNWALKGSRGSIVTIASEHAAVLDTVRTEGVRGRDVTVLPVRPDGRIDLWVARRVLGQGAGVLAAMLVNNEIGVVQPVPELARIARQHGALVLCDAVQAYGRVAVPDACDMVAISAHKIHGPKGIGALWIRDGVKLDSLLDGGDQEHGRSGTLSPALCVAFGVAARLMKERHTVDTAHVERLWDMATDRLRGWTINGSADCRYHGNLNVRRRGLDVNRLMSDCRNVAFSAGSACASGSGRPSHVLKAIGLLDAEARSSIRLGFGRYTTEAELEEGLAAIIAAAEAQQLAA